MGVKEVLEGVEELEDLEVLEGSKALEGLQEGTLPHQVHPPPASTPSSSST